MDHNDASNAFNSATLSDTRDLGLTWHSSVWIATAANFNAIPEGIRLLSYQAQESVDCEFIDESIREIARGNEGPEELLLALDNAGLMGWVVLVKLQNRVYLESGDVKPGKTTFDRWFYGESLLEIRTASKEWAIKKLEEMKQNSLYHRAQNAINETVGLHKIA